MSLALPLFLLTLASTVGALAAIARRASPRRYVFMLAGLAGWLALTGTLALAGRFSNFQNFPPLIMYFIVTGLAAATLLARRVPSEVPLYWLIGFQVFRIPVELFLYEGHLDGFVPIQMSWSGRNWDVLTGLGAIPIAWLASRNTLPRWALQIWNIIGFGLLLNIMSIAVLSLPTPIRQFHNEPANVFVAGIPYIWLPAILVPAAWFGHIAIFHRAR